MAYRISLALRNIYPSDELLEKHQMKLPLPLMSDAAGTYTSTETVNACPKPFIMLPNWVPMPSLALGLILMCPMWGRVSW